jgi:hypothetical protein
MGCDMFSIDSVPLPHHTADLGGAEDRRCFAGLEDGSIRLCYMLSWDGIVWLVSTLAHAGAIDFDTSPPSFPPLPPAPADWPRGAVWDGRSPHPLAREWAATIDVLRRTTGPERKPPEWKLASNDGWVVTPDECAIIAEALTAVTRADMQTLLAERDYTRRNRVTWADADSHERGFDPELEACALRNDLNDPGLNEGTRELLETLLALTQFPDAYAEQFGCIDGSPDSEAEIDDWLGVCADFADFCEGCREYGGFEVW